VAHFIGLKCWRPHCNGSLYIDKTHYGWIIKCLSCTREVEMFIGREPTRKHVLDFIASYKPVEPLKRVQRKGLF